MTRTLTARALHLFTVYTVLDVALIAGALDITPLQANSAVCGLRVCHRIVRHHACNPRRKQCRTAFTLPGGKP